MDRFEHQMPSPTTKTPDTASNRPRGSERTQKTIQLAIFSATIMFCNSAFARCDPALPPSSPMTIGAPASHYLTLPFSLREDGVIVFDYGDRYDNLGKWPNPYFVANYALGLYRDYLDSGCTNDELSEQFLTQARYLASSFESRGDAAVWTYPFENQQYNLDRNWISGIGQSRIAGTLIRATALSGDPSFSDLGAKAMLPYALDLEAGGVVYDDGEVLWIEEAADPHGSSYRILNGHNSGLIGLVDVASITADETWDRQAERGFAAVVRDLPRFDLGYSSLYSIGNPTGDNLVSPLGTYHSLHVAQLLALYDQVPDHRFLDYASRWLSYLTRRDTNSASSSTAPTTNGPEMARVELNNPRSYWSAQAFPAFFQVDLDHAAEISGFATLSPSLPNSPKDYSVEILQDGNWIAVAEGGNSSRHLTVEFEPIMAQSVRFHIRSDNGANNVALQVGAPIRARPTYEAITNYCNHRVDGAGFQHLRMFQEGQEFSPTCPGWIILPVGQSQRLRFGSSLQLQVSASGDLDSFAPIEPASDGSYAIGSAKFVRLEFEEIGGSISDLTLD